MLAMAKICDSEVPAEVQTPITTHEELLKRDKNVYWSNKKWCGQILMRFIQKFGNDKTVTSSDKPYAQKIRVDYLVPFLKIFILGLLKRKTTFVAQKYTFYAAKYCYYGMANVDFLSLLNEHLEELLFDVFLPMVNLSLIDLHNWKFDPAEFIHRQEDFSHVAKDLKHQGLDNVALICKLTAPDKTRYLFKFMQFALAVLEKGVNPRTMQKVDDLEVEAILHCIDILEDQIAEVKAIQNEMETFLVKFVIPYFNNSSGFFRACACKMFGTYGRIKFQNNQNVLLATEGIYKCLTDKDLPVRVYVIFHFI